MEVSKSGLYSKVVYILRGQNDQTTLKVPVYKKKLTGEVKSGLNSKMVS